MLAVLTPSWPLESCRLTVCSNCCSSLTVWFSQAVSFSFLSISSCLRERQMVYLPETKRTETDADENTKTLVQESHRL